jgi:hypothetical protein
MMMAMRGRETFMLARKVRIVSGGEGLDEEGVVVLRRGCC